MNHTRQFEVSESVLNKRADMQKVINAIEEYRPWNARDARSAMPYTAAAGAGAGAILGGGSAMVQRLFGKDEEDEEDKPSVWKRALAGAGFGALAGAQSPLGLAATRPHIANALEDHVAKSERARMDEDPGFFENLMPGGMKDWKADTSGSLTGKGFDMAAPSLTMQELVSALREKRQQQQ